MTTSAPNDFTSILADLDDGNVVNNLTEQLRRITLGVLETKKAGSLTLKISIRNEGKTLVLATDVSAKVPQPATESTTFFADQKGYLQKDNPAQQPLKGVPAAKPAEPLRVVDNKSKVAGEEG